MAVETKYWEDKTPIQAGGMGTDEAQTVAAGGVTTAFTADKFVEVTPVAADSWILIVDADTGTAGSGVGRLVPVGSTTRPFLLKAGKLIETSAQINVCTLDVVA